MRHILVDSKLLYMSFRRIYIARPTIPITKLIMEQLKAEKSVGEDRLYTVVYVPRAVSLSGHYNEYLICPSESANLLLYLFAYCLPKHNV